VIDYSRYKTLKIDKQDSVAIVTLNRPDALNAITVEMHGELEDIFEDIVKDEEVNVMVLTAAGRAFCAGGDLRMMKSLIDDPSERKKLLVGARRLIHNLLEVEKPIIAALNGDTIGLGATIALMCDIIIAAEGVRIGDPHVRVGIVAGDGGAVIWPLLTSLAKAKELLFTGDLIKADEAERLGLLNKVVPKEELMPTALELAQRLATGPTLAIRWTKRCLNKRLRDEVNLAFDVSLALEELTFLSDDHKEAVHAFLEKRAPRFKGT